MISGASLVCVCTSLRLHIGFHSVGFGRFALDLAHGQTSREIRWNYLRKEESSVLHICFFSVNHKAR